MTEKHESNRDRSQVLSAHWEDELRAGQEAEGERGSVEPELAMLHLLRHAREPESLQASELDAIWSDIETEIAPAHTPWWRKAWVWWAAPALATAAVLVVVLLPPGDRQDEAVALSDDKAEDARHDGAREDNRGAPSELSEGEAPGHASDRAAMADPAPAPAADEAIGGEATATAKRAGYGGGASRTDSVNSFESSYVQLAPHGRAALTVAVDTSRDELRGRLLADARKAGGR